MITALEKVARNWAIEAHGDQMYGERPYIYHLDMVRDAAEKYGLSQNVRVAALLHDTLEDTKKTYEDIVNVFGENVADLVKAVTDHPGDNRRERHEKTYPHTRKAGRDAVALKLCDRISNATASFEEGKKSLFHAYQREYAFFRYSLYLPEDCLEPLWSELETVLAGHL